MLDATAAIEQVVLASPVVCSDETSVRVKGKNWWEVRRTPHGTSVRFAARRVFIGKQAVLHKIVPSLGKAVVTDLFGTTRPLVWVSDMLGSQRGHAVQWQVCLAHLLRDATMPWSAAISPSACRSGLRNLMSGNFCHGLEAGLSFHLR